MLYIYICIYTYIHVGIFTRARACRTGVLVRARGLHVLGRGFNSCEDSRVIVRMCKCTGCTGMLVHCPETDPTPRGKKLPKCKYPGPGRLRKSISVVVRASFWSAIGASARVAPLRICGRFCRPLSRDPRLCQTTSTDIRPSAFVLRARSTNSRGHGRGYERDSPNIVSANRARVQTWPWS